MNAHHLQVDIRLRRFWTLKVGLALLSGVSPLLSQAAFLRAANWLLGLVVVEMGHGGMVTREPLSKYATIDEGCLR